MSLVEPSSPETAYLSKPNIVHPDSERPDYASRVADAEARGRAEIALRRGVATLTGGSIRKGK